MCETGPNPATTNTSISDKFCDIFLLHYLRKKLGGAEDRLEERGFDDGAQIMPLPVRFTADLSVVDTLRSRRGWEREPDDCGTFLHGLIVREHEK